MDLNWRSVQSDEATAADIAVPEPARLHVGDGRELTIVEWSPRVKAGRDLRVDVKADVRRPNGMLATWVDPCEADVSFPLVPIDCKDGRVLKITAWLVKVKVKEPISVRFRALVQRLRHEHDR